MFMEGISMAVSGLRASERRLAQSAHNLANLSTPGFAPGRVELSDVAQGGVQVAGTTYPSQPGPLLLTENSLDLAIDGGGFFVLDGGQGARVYTRAGNFVLDAAGRIVDPQGRALSPEISIPQDAVSIEISPQGQVRALAADGSVLAQGQIQTAAFGNPGGLQPVGGNAFAATEASGPPVTDVPATAGHGSIVSGALQGSGTDIVGEMTGLMITQRAFEANLAAISTYDDMVGSILDATA